jgi:hypothetical protein
MSGLTDGVYKLNDYLLSPINLRNLFLQNIKNHYSDGLLFIQLPCSFSEPFRRITFQVVTHEGENFFLKISSHLSKIRREYEVFKIFSDEKLSGFSYPEILNFEENCAIDSEQNQYCSYFISEWIDGYKINIHNRTDVAYLANILVKVSRNSFTLDWINRKTGGQIQSINELSKSIRDLYDDELLRGERSYSHPIIETFNEARKNIRNIPYMTKLNHGDFHTNNVLIKSNSDKRKLFIIDWEDASLENPLYDLSHFLFCFHPDYWVIFLIDYFKFSRQPFLDYSSRELQEMVMAMVKLWASRLLRWECKSALNENDINNLCDKYFIQIKKIESLPWRKIINK